MNYKQISLSQLTLSGLSTALTRSQNENFEIIKPHWQTFNKLLINIDLGYHWKKYGITYKEDDNYNYMTII